MTDSLARRLAALSPDRIKTLVGSLDKKTPSLPRMPRTPNQCYALSSAQERLWFLSQLSPESPAFNNPAAIKMYPREPLDQGRLQKALESMGERHEILRTTFHLDRGKPVQAIHQTLPLFLEWQDLRYLGEQERQEEALGIAIEEGRAKFDLTQGPLLRLKVLQLGELDYFLLITSHHLISDGWSNAIFARELSALYAGQQLSPLEIQYIDYVEWERNWLASEACAEQLRFWRQNLNPQASPLSLPLDQARPRAISHQGAMETRPLSTGLAERLRLFARQERLGLFPIMMSTLAVVLSRYTGAKRIPIGTITANRNEREFQKLMGPLLNTLVVSCELEEGDTWHKLLRRQSQICNEALARQQLPFNKLLNSLEVSRDLGVHPLFQVMLVIQNVPSQYQAGEMRTEVVKVDYQTTKLDLNFWVEEINDSIVLTLYYASNLFERITIERFLNHFEDVLLCVVDSTDSLIADVAFSGTLIPESPPPPTVTKSLIERFAQQVCLTPDQAAVVGRGGSLTYSELERLTNRIARLIAAHPEALSSPIGLLLGRDGLSSISALLGVLKAGGCYLPLNPADPPERWREILQDAGSILLLCDEQLSESIAKLAQTIPITCKRIDEAREYSDHPLEVIVCAETPAYVIYTSGSTGKPKGVCVEHRQLVAYADGVWERMGLGSGHRFATVSPLATDFGNTMIFPPLIKGGCVVVVPEDTTQGSRPLARYLAEQPVDCLKITPTHLLALLDSADILPAKLLVLGGETCNPALIDRIRKLRPDLRIMNHYGPTETTIGVLTYEVPNPWPGGTLPLGQPLRGTQITICDAAGRELPQGAVGEIRMAGATVARGYWGQPELTAAYFVNDPVSGVRCYRSGDQGRLTGDGSIVFCGRKDRQVKLRGYRVELDEIETTLAGHALVTQAAVRLDREGRLEAFVVAAGAVEEAVLLRFLKGRLPSVMVPSRLVLIEVLPRTASGKIDYGKLPSLPLGDQSAISSVPRDEVELALMLIWHDLFPQRSFGIHDDFFELGGHSLLAIRLMSLVCERFGQELPLATLFEYGTIAGLAALLKGESNNDDGPLVTIRQSVGQSALALVHPAGGEVLCYYSLAYSLPDHYSILGLRARLSDGDPSLKAIARRYFEAIADHSLQAIAGWSMGALIAFEIAILFERELGRLPPVILLDQPAPTDSQLSTVIDELTGLASFAAKVSQLVGTDIGINQQRLEQETPIRRAEMFLAAFKRHGLAAEETKIKDFQNYLELMLLHNRATQSYHCCMYSGEVILLRAEDKLASLASPNDSDDLGWQHWCKRRLRIVPVPGNHVTMMRSPNVQVLASRLATALEAAT